MDGIKSVSARHWKGHDFDHSIEKLNLIVGPNGSGKTSVCDAIRWACTGTSRAGDSPTAAIAYTDDGMVEARVGLLSGATWTRSLQRVGAQVKQTVAVAGQRGPTLAEHEAEVRCLTGGFAPQFDLGAVLGLSADKKRDFFVDLCARAGTTGESTTLADRLALEWFRLHMGPATVDAYAEAHPATGDLIRHMFGRLSAADQDAHLWAMEAIVAEIRGEQSEAIGAALAKAGELVNASAAEHKRLSGAIQKLSDEADGLVSPAATAEALKTRLDGLHAEAERMAGLLGKHRERGPRRLALEQEIGRLAASIAEADTELTESYRAMEAIQEGRTTAEIATAIHAADQTEAEAAKRLRMARGESDRLASQIDTANAVLATLEAETGDVEGLRRELADLEARVQPTAVQVHRLAVETAQAEARSAQTRAAAAQRTMNEATLAYHRTADAAAALRDSPWIQALRLWERCSEGEPPTLDGAEAWNVLDALIRQHADPARLARAEAELTTARQASADADDAYRVAAEADDAAQEAVADALLRLTEERQAEAAQQALAGEIRAAREAIGRLESRDSRIADARKRIAELMEQAAAAAVRTTAAQVEHESAAAELPTLRTAHQQAATRESIERDIARLTRERNDAADRKFAAEESIAQINADGTANVDELEAQAFDIEVQTIETERDLKRRRGADELHALLLKTRADCEQEQVYHECCKTFVAAIKTLRETLVDSLLGPLVAHVDRFLAATGFRFWYNLTGTGKKIVFDLGLVMDDVQVSVVALGGAHFALFSAAMIYGCLQLADPPLKLLLIEGAELSARTLEPLLRCIEAVRDGLSNAIVCTRDYYHDRETREVMLGNPAYCYPAPKGWNTIDLAPVATREAVTA